MARINETVKVVMLKGEKGDVGNPTDNQVLGQVAKYIQENPEVTIDETIIDTSTKEWLNNHPIAHIGYEENGTFELPVHTINDNTITKDSTWSSETIYDAIAWNDVYGLVIPYTAWKDFDHETLPEWVRKDIPDSEYAMYSATVSVDGITQTDYARAYLSSDNFYLLSFCSTGDGTVTFYALDKPEANMKINMLEWRKAQR